MFRACCSTGRPKIPRLKSFAQAAELLLENVACCLSIIRFNKILKSANNQSLDTQRLYLEDQAIKVDEKWHDTRKCRILYYIQTVC